MSRSGVSRCARASAWRTHVVEAGHPGAAASVDPMPPTRPRWVPAARRLRTSERGRPVRCLRSLVNERNKKFAGTKPANSRENVNSWFTSGTRSRQGRRRMRTVYKLAPGGTRPEAVRNTTGNKACSKACSKVHSNTASPRLWRRPVHRSRRSMNHEQTQQVRRRGLPPAYWQALKQEEFVGTYVSPFPTMIDRRPLGRFRCFLGRSLEP